MAIKDLKNLSINLNYFIESGFITNYNYTIHRSYLDDRVTSGIYLIDGYPNELADMKAPTVALNHDITTPEALQLGPGTEMRSKFSIDVFGRNDTDRNDLSDIIREQLDTSMIIYDYNQVINDSTYVQIGKADFENVIMRSLRLNEPVKWAKHIMSIQADVVVAITSGNALL